MLTNHPRGVSRSSLPGLAVVLVLSGCGGAEPGAAPGGTAGPVRDGSGGEEVAETPAARAGDSEPSGETTMVGATDPGASSPESVSGAAFDLAPGGSDDGGGRAGEGDGAAAAGDEGGATAEGNTGGEAVVEAPACAIAHAAGVVNQQLTSGGRQFVVIAAGGHAKITEEPQGDSLVAFAMENSRAAER